MPTVKISNLPEVATLANSDLLTAVASNVSSKITVTNFANTLTQVSSSISASHAVTASYALNAGGGAGSSGTSGVNGSSGTSGQTGTSGTSGQTGNSGTSGTSGTGFNSISNFSDNRVLTSNGTSNEASAETNFTFDGSVAFLTGSLIVSGANGGGIFSQGATLVDYSSGISNSGSYMVWRAPFSCSVVALYGYYLGGSTPQVNALRSGSSGIGLITASNLTVSSQNVWIAALTNFQNKDFNVGDGLTVIMSGSANNQLAVQVDFIRKS